MYSLLPKNARNICLFVFGGVLVVLWGVVEDFGLSWSAFRVISAAVSIFVGVVWFALGTPSYWSPWRVLWRWFPSLNVLVYPDLNGLWVGKTQSNWPVIARMRSAALSGKKITEDEVSEVELQTGGIALHIVASLFGIRVTCAVSNTDSRSYSVTAKAVRGELSGEVVLHYIYRQETPRPVSTDESSHLGAATLHFFGSDKDAADGEYWTRRRWKEGLNTAGLIVISRESERYGRRQKSLREFAEEAS